MRSVLISCMIVVLTFIGINAFSTPKASAEIAPGCNPRSSFLALPPWYAYLDVGPKTLENKKGEVIGSDPCAIIGPTDASGFSFELALPRIVLAVIEILLRIAGMIAFGFVVYGGFRYITSQGEPEALKQAQSTIINALIGMAITVLAVTMVAFAGGILW